VRERDGSPISGQCLVRLGTAALAGLRVLVLHGDEMGKERGVPEDRLALGRVGNWSKCN
jgi:hypothetical protein